MRAAVATLAGLALALPAPRAAAHDLRVPLCNGGTTTITLPGNPEDNDRQEACRKACHAVDPRRKRLPGCC